jgi:hypothetical protein
MTLRDKLPKDFMLEYADTQAATLMDVEVAAEHERDSTNRPWPGPHKNVHVWWELVDGHAVAWNENPANGWTFPVVRLASAKRGG